ncbi:MAG: sulfotransferase [Planctomycetota bacterium]
MTLPSFVIIGAMKCATSTLASQLAAQPGVFVSDPKEPNFFSDDEVYARGTGWYVSLFESAAEGDLVGEASTHYTKLPTHPKAAERLREHLPDAKLVYVMRHPIDRLVSQYVHEWSQKLVGGPIDDAVRANEWMIDYGRYAMQLEPWLEAFGPDRVLPVFAERMRAEPQSVLERVCTFLGYVGTPEWRELGDQNVSAARTRKSALRDAVVDAPGLKQLRRTLVPKTLRTRVRSLWQMKERPVLGEQLRAELESVYDEDLGRLGRLLGLAAGGLTCASFARVAAARDYGFAAEVAR